MAGAYLERCGADTQAPGWRGIAAASRPVDPCSADAQAAVTASNTRLERYRAALEAGTDPTIVNTWITEVSAARAAAEHRLKQLTAKRILTEDDIEALIEGVGDVMAAFRGTCPELKAELYDRLGLTIHYNHANRTARLTIDPGRLYEICVRGPTSTWDTFRRSPTM